MADPLKRMGVALCSSKSGTTTHVREITIPTAAGRNRGVHDGTEGAGRGVKQRFSLPAVECALPPLASPLGAGK